MLRRVRIKEVGDTKFLLDDQVANISLVEDLANQTQELSIALNRAANEVPLLQEIRGRIIRDGLSVRETERICRQQKATNTAPKVTKTSKIEGELPLSYCRAMTTQLVNHLNTKVRVVQNGQRGKLEIEYYSSDDLDRLMSLLTE